MKFANPLFFWALLTLAIPVIIHLFHFRTFKTVYFTNVKFLKALREETQSRSRLKHLLVLIARCLALIALITAFAQPFIPASKKTVSGPKSISIYIDNSFSMDAQGESSSLLELAKKHALDIASSYKPSDKFQLLTNDFEGKHQRFVTLEQFGQLVQEVKASAASKEIKAVISRQRNSLSKEEAKNKIVYILSDFQKNSSLFDGISSDTSLLYNFVHLKANIEDNVSIDSLWFETPNRDISKNDQISFRLNNFSEKRNTDFPVSLYLKKLQKGIQSVSIGPDSILNSFINFKTDEIGFQNGCLKINDFPITFDDSFYFSYEVQNKLNVLSINGLNSNPSIALLFQNNEAFEFSEQNESRLDYSTLLRYQIIVLNQVKEISTGLAQEIKKYTDNGGSILIFPSPEIDLNSYKYLTDLLNIQSYKSEVNLNQKVDQINYEHEIYDDVFDKKPDNIDLPFVIKYFPINGVSSTVGEEIMRFQNGDPFMKEYQLKKGKAYLSSVALNETFSNFTKHALYIPTLYKIALYSRPFKKLYNTIGDGLPIVIPQIPLNGDATFKIKSIENDFEIIPEHRLFDGQLLIYPNNQIIEAGNYLITLGDTIITGVSFNYNRSESNPERLTQDKLLESLEKSGLVNFNVLNGAQKELRQEVSQLEEGKPLWKYFIIASLLFLLSEILLIRYLKR
jgi:hypothetical protein